MRNSSRHQAHIKQVKLCLRVAEAGGSLLDDEKTAHHPQLHTKPMLEGRLMPLATSWVTHLSLQLLEAESILWQRWGLLGTLKAGRSVILQHRLKELHRVREITQCTTW